MPVQRRADLRGSASRRKPTAPPAPTTAYPRASISSASSSLGTSRATSGSIRAPSGSRKPLAIAIGGGTSTTSLARPPGPIRQPRRRPRATAPSTPRPSGPGPAPRRRRGRSRRQSPRPGRAARVCLRPIRTVPVPLGPARPATVRRGRPTRLGPARPVRRGRPTNPGPARPVRRGQRVRRARWRSSAPAYSSLGVRGELIHQRGSHPSVQAGALGDVLLGEHVCLLMQAVDEVPPVVRDQQPQLDIGSGDLDGDPLDQLVQAGTGARRDDECPRSRRTSRSSTSGSAASALLMTTISRVRTGSPRRAAARSRGSRTTSRAARPRAGRTPRRLLRPASRPCRPLRPRPRRARRARRRSGRRVGVRPVDDVQQHVGVGDLLERRAERLDELVRQVAHESDGVGERVRAGRRASRRGAPSGRGWRTARSRRARPRR